MRTKRASQLVAAGFSLFISCGDEQYVEYVIYVGHFDVPAWVQADAFFYVTLQGTVGPDGCHSFSHVDAVRRPDRVELTVVGSHWGRGRTRGCSTASVPLDERFAVTPPFDGDEFVVVVHQPDGTAMRRSVAVRK